MEYIALGIVPGLIIILFILYKDRYNREPKLNLFISFLLGCISIIPAIWFEKKFQTTIDGTIQGVAIFSYAVVAFSEEFSKFIALRGYAYRQKSFDEPFDGIVYSILVGMGFATVENVMYVVSFAQMGIGLQISLQRMLLSVPAHATFAVIMGYFAGKAKFDSANSFLLLLMGLAAAIFFHGTYDFFLFIHDLSYVGKELSEGLLIAGALVSLVVALVLSRNLIRKQRNLSQEMFKMKIPTSVYNIQYATVDDIPLIRELALKVWPQTYSSILSEDQIVYMMELMYSSASLAKQVAQGAQFIIVSDDKEPVGFASYQEIGPGIFKLHKIYVLTNQQGKGTGRFIIDHIITEIKAKGATALQLQVNRNNKARYFYEKLGFMVIDEINLDIGNGYVMDDYIMEKKW